MPGVVQRGRGRRTMNEINMVPFIDVMLVLLIIFMVTAPLITTGVVDLPTVGKSGQSKPRFVELQIGTDEALRLRVDGKEIGRATLASLAAQVSTAQAGDPAMPVVIAADRNVKYESVVKAMDVLQRAGIQRVGLSVKSSAAP
ncbi:ExbD/TolR family protein [Ramlibacter sp.]|uniref:ExbD/TolR family protein n=1 Tax=Ramlibacter sp. TaxID=1917967 RepID=UPI0017AF576C|nr:ExbD/TolR family protein [Ramlibacter sp.]MBA2674031.1 ExbD/TolR family protein [Ramlibacter sp.]